MILPPSVIADHPPKEMYRAGLEIEAQCARCGSSMDSERCGQCEGGLFFDGDGDPVRCSDCAGQYVWHRCLSSPEYCQANPLPGRESVERGKVEWFCYEEKP